jgi:predicted transcriptional regulator
MKPTAQFDPVMATALRDLLTRDPVCREIVQYLMRNSEAADTARGIAEWWIGRDVSSTREALSKLHACGVVQSYAVQGNTFVYAYTKKAVLRQSLARYLQGAIEPRVKER